VKFIQTVNPKMVPALKNSKILRVKFSSRPLHRLWVVQNILKKG
jgi:hypothetical protein